MLRIVLPITISIILTFSAVLTSGLESVSANQSLKEKIHEMQHKQQELKQERNAAQAEIAAIQSERKAIEAEIKKIDLAVAETKENIRAKQGEIEGAKQEIEALKQEIVALMDRMKKREELLKDRMRSLQQTGGVVSYLDVLLGAQSFGDFLDRVSAVSVIVQQDKEILRQHKEDKELLETKQNELSDKLATLEDKLKDLETLQANYLAQKKEKDRIVQALKKEEEQIHDDIYEIEEEADLLAKQEAAMKKLYQQWLEEQRRIAEAKKRGEAPPITDGTFMRPSTGPVTSNYGSRWGRLHAGIDIGKRGDDVPIVASASGIVFRSYYSSSYGNVVFITHNVNGEVWTTVYAHMESRAVSEGETVKKGQRIGYMGNTGRSFGAHLHFELHKGKWNIEKSNSVDPKKHIKF